jgi:hypothetical protein
MTAMQLDISYNADSRKRCTNRTMSMSRGDIAHLRIAEATNKHKSWQCESDPNAI